MSGPKLIWLIFTEARGFPVAQLLKKLPAMRETWVRSLGRAPGEGKGYPLHCSGLENCMDCTVHGVTVSDTTERLLLSLSLLKLTYVPGSVPGSGSKR